MKGSSSRRRKATRQLRSRDRPAPSLDNDYLRIRDFEYVQPLYDLAFLLEVDALARNADVPKYRTFALWRAAYSLDGYGTTIDQWLDGTIGKADLDYIPSSRIRQYLTKVRLSGSIPELRSYRSKRFERCLRLRSVRGLGPSKIALTLLPHSLAEEWFREAASNLGLNYERFIALYNGHNVGPWQAAHIVPPLIRFLHTVEQVHGGGLRWAVSGVADPFEPVVTPLTVVTRCEWDSAAAAVAKALRREKHFRRDSPHDGSGIRIRHQMGWQVAIRATKAETRWLTLAELAQSLDPLATHSYGDLRSDLHVHTAWSDGSASVNMMAKAVVASGLEYFAVTDHSRSSKLQGGLTPVLWLRQASALTLASPVSQVLHGIEVDILKDGALDLPHSVLSAADLVVGSVHSNWTGDVRTNTDRLLRAIESGLIDILAHPTSAIVGKPGVPDYHRPPADVHWPEVFDKCACWRVALELNCFPSRLDLPLPLLRLAIDRGCAIAIGSDAHARSHLLNLRFGQAALRRLEARVVLNRMPCADLRRWIAESRKQRAALPRSTSLGVQTEFQFEKDPEWRAPVLRARIQPPARVPAGSRVVGIDLTAGQKASGIAMLDGLSVDTCSLFSDNEILEYVKTHRPKIVSIDSPLGLPGGGESIAPDKGIMRVAEHDLASVGIPAYPSLIESMKKLTLRGIRLRRAMERLPGGPRVIESYPGAAQDILSIPRKQRSLDLLREGLKRLGLTGRGIETRSHDEMDAITSAIVARYFECDRFEAMGIQSEAQLIVPKIRPMVFDSNPVICLAGRTAAGKSVTARYLSLFYGFEWVRTRNVIRQLLEEDLAKPSETKLFRRRANVRSITEKDLRYFGALILNQHKQRPLRKRLTETLTQLDAPVVVDSIRDTVDVDRATLGDLPILIWFVDCTDSLIRNRLAKRVSIGEKRPPTGSPVDKTAPTIRRQADAVIPNVGSLEDLRWRIDDELFSLTHLYT